MENEMHMDKMSKVSEMMNEMCAKMDEMKSIIDEMVSGENMDEGEYLKSSPEKRESYDKMKMMSRGNNARS